MHYKRWQVHGDPLVFLHKQTCEVEGCNKKHKARGYCINHYERYKRHGDVNIVLCNRGKYKSFIESYESNVIRNDNGCWAWKGVVSKHGYPMIYANGKSIRAHRFSYSHFVELIEDGLIICHKCDNTLCTRPDHLFKGTHKDNTQDCINKNRFKIPPDSSKVKGSHSVRAKLNEEQVYKIKELIRDGLTNKPIAAMFGVVHGTISLIRLNRTWKHVGENHYGN